MRHNKFDKSKVTGRITIQTALFEHMPPISATFTRPDRLVLGKLCNWQIKCPTKDGGVAYTIGKMARDMKMGENTIRKAIKDIISNGYGIELEPIYLTQTYPFRHIKISDSIINNPKVIDVCQNIIKRNKDAEKMFNSKDKIGFEKPLDTNTYATCSPNILNVLNILKDMNIINHIDISKVSKLVEEKLTDSIKSGSDISNSLVQKQEQIKDINISEQSKDKVPTNPDLLEKKVCSTEVNVLTTDDLWKYWLLLSEGFITKEVNLGYKDYFFKVIPIAVSHNGIEKVKDNITAWFSSPQKSYVVGYFISAMKFNTISGEVESKKRFSSNNNQPLPKARII